MKADFFNKKFNYQNISHAYLFECKPSKKFNEEINNLIKKILCVDKQKNDRKKNLNYVLFKSIEGPKSLLSLFSYRYVWSFSILSLSPFR